MRSLDLLVLHRYMRMVLKASPAACPSRRRARPAATTTPSRAHEAALELVPEERPLVRDAALVCVVDRRGNSK